MENGTSETDNGYYAVAFDALELLPLVRALATEHRTFTILEGLVDGRLQQGQKHQQQATSSAGVFEGMSVLPTEILLKIKEHYLAMLTDDSTCGAWLAVGRANLHRYHPQDCCSDKTKKMMLDFDEVLRAINDLPRQEDIGWVYHLVAEYRIQGRDAQAFLAFLKAHSLELCHFPDPAPEYRNGSHRRQGKANPVDFEGMNMYIGVAGQTLLWRKMPRASPDKESLIAADADEAARRSAQLKAFAGRYNLTVQRLPRVDGDEAGVAEPGYAFRKRYPELYDNYPGVE